MKFKFRAKTVSTDRWAEGSLVVTAEGDCWIQIDDENNIVYTSLASGDRFFDNIVEVQPETVELIRPECVWSFDWDLERYTTSCNNEWRVCGKTDTPAAGNMRYCPYCGGKLVEKIEEVQE